MGPDSSLVRELPAFNAYMEKVCAAMKLGRPYSDVAVYLPLEDQWMKGELPQQQQKPSAKYHWETALPAATGRTGRTPAAVGVGAVS